MKTIMTDYSTPGLKGDGQYWRVLDFSEGGPYISGFIAEDDLIFDT